MRSLARHRSCKHSKLPVVAGVSPANPANLTVPELFAGRGRPGSIGTHRRRTLEMACPQAVLWIYEMASSLCLATIAGVFCPALVAFGQDVAPTPQTAGQPVVTAVEVIVTGSNI